MNDQAGAFEMQSAGENPVTCRLISPSLITPFSSICIGLALASSSPSPASFSKLDYP